MSGPDPRTAPSDPEDLKIITLARSARARTGASVGCCVRDTDGRTYAAAAVALPHLQLSALTVALAMAASSGATSLEAVAVVAGSRDEAAPAEAERDALTDFAGAGPVAVWVSGPDGDALGWSADA